MKDNMIVLQQKTMNTSYLNAIKEGSKSDETYHPVQFTVITNGCPEKMTYIVNELSDIEVALEDFQSPQLSNETRNETQLELIHKLTELFYGRYTKILDCLEEYPAALQSVQEWVQNMKEKAKDFTDGEPFHGVLYNYTMEAELLKQDENNLLDLMRKYAQGKITKLDYLESFSQSSQMLSNLNRFVEHIVNRLTDPLKTRLEEIRANLQNYYMDSLQRAVEFERYLEKGRFYGPASNMRIWKIPYWDWGNPESVVYVGRETWRIWDSTVPIEEFVKHMAAR